MITRTRSVHLEYYTTPVFTAAPAIPTRRVRSRARATSSLPPITSPRDLSLIARVSSPHLCAYSLASLAPPVVAAARRPTTPDRTTTSTSASCCRHRHSSWSLDRYFVVLFLPCLKSVSLSCHACLRCATGNVAVSDFAATTPRRTCPGQLCSAARRSSSFARAHNSPSPARCTPSIRCMSQVSPTQNQYLRSRRRRNRRPCRHCSRVPPPAPHHTAPHRTTPHHTAPHNFAARRPRPTMTRR